MKFKEIEKGGHYQFKINGVRYTCDNWDHRYVDPCIGLYSGIHDFMPLGRWNKSFKEMSALDVYLFLFVCLKFGEHVVGTNNLWTSLPKDILPHKWIATFLETEPFNSLLATTFHIPDFS